MKFLFCAPRYHTNLHYRIKALTDHGHKVAFFSLYQGASEYYEAVTPEILGYSKLFLFFNKIFNPRGEERTKNNFELKYGYPSIITLWRKMKRVNPDVVVIKNIHSAYSLLTAFFAKLQKRKIIFLLQIPKFRQQEQSGSVAFVERWFNALVITPVLGDEKYANENDNLVYIPFVHPVVQGTHKKDGGDTIRILSVGKFQKRKDQMLLLNAVSKLLKRGHSLKLTLIGEIAEPKYFEHIKKRAESDDFRGMVTIRTNLSWPEVQEEYSQHDIFVLPSYGESAAYSILEAMAHGLPVISSDDNGTRGYVVSERNGYCFHARDVNDLAEKLGRIIAHSDVLREMSEQSIREVGEKYGPDEFYNRFIKALDWNTSQ